MKLVTLENSFALARAPQPAAKTLASLKVPHFSALKDPSIAGDITGASFGNPGAAMGAPGTMTNNFGVFTDKYGNLRMVAAESSKSFQLAKSKQLYKDAKVISVERFFGNGSGEVNAKVLVMGTEKDDRPSTSFNSSILQSQSQASVSAMDMFAQLETGPQGPDTQRPILYLLAGSPITISDIAKVVLELVLAGAKIIATTIGIPAAYIDTITPILEKLSQNQAVTLSDIVSIANLIAPASIRPYMDKASTIVTAAGKQDYASMARALGVSTDSAMRFTGNMLTDVVTTSKLGTEQASKVVQNILNIDTIQKFRNGLRSGSTIQKIIDDGTVVNVAAVQNWLIAQGASTITSSVPNIADFVGSVINQTEDIANVHEYRAWLSTAFGLPTHPDIFDELTVRSLVQRAVAGVNTGQKVFTMPIGIEINKRLEMAKEVSAQTGLHVVVPGQPNVFY